YKACFFARRSKKTCFGTEYGVAAGRGALISEDGTIAVGRRQDVVLKRPAEDPKAVGYGAPLAPGNGSARERRRTPTPPERSQNSRFIPLGQANSGQIRPKWHDEERLRIIFDPPARSSEGFQGRLSGGSRCGKSLASSTAASSHAFVAGSPN